MAHAFNIALTDSSVHAYAQRFCFLNGPDRELNSQLRAAVLACKRPLPEERDADRIQLLDLAEQRRIAGELRERLHVPPELGLDARTVDAWIENLGWKVAAVPASARSVLVLGSESAREAIFLRHRLPDAKIVVTDFVDQRLPNVERALGVTFHQGDFNQLLEQHPGAFDAVFSNHVLEHLFEPDKTLRLIKRALTPSGVMVAALPLDGQPDAPFSAALNAAELHPLDMCTIDVGHPWKTNVSNLLVTLHETGFTDMRFSTREGYYSVAQRQFRSRDAFHRRARLGKLLNAALFGSTRGVLKRVFPETVPLPVLKLVFGLEHRVWFGSNRLKNEFSVECLVVAR
ncbi:MAG TPA: class I SAM-dependent methyltransferase [Polyangiales bacterium]|nr:class I SAM-dependent methyltransferase [Polyangiales bacterium]